MKLNKGAASTDKDRRNFIKKAGAGTAILMTMGYQGWSAEETEKRPLHPGLLLSGIYGYPSQESAEAGNMIKFCISSSMPYRTSICKLGSEIDNPKADIVLFTSPQKEAYVQSIHPGSYVYVANGLKGSFPNFSAEGWIKLWKNNKPQAVISQHDFKVILDPSGSLSLVSNGEIQTTPARLIQYNTWHHWAVGLTDKDRVIFIDGKEISRTTNKGKLKLKLAPLILGASINGKNQLENLLDADIAAIKIYDYSLSPDEIRKSFEEKGLKKNAGKGLLAYWYFNEEKGDTVADHSGNKRDGKIINHATWMVGGPSMSYEVERFREYNPEKDSQRGHALRLASDDLYDCEWKENFEYKVPEDAKPGFYVARLLYNQEGKEEFYDISFIVKRNRSLPKAPILVLAATNTWRAYNGAPFALKPSTLKYSISTDGGPNHPLAPPAYCFYRKHFGEQGTYQIGHKIPWPAAGPYVLYGSDYSHLLRGERYTHLWLDKEGYDFDLVTDSDLHKNPEMLKEYSVFLINGHSEYWSIPMYRGLENYLKGNGKIIVLSGNSMFWRVSYNDDCSILECRKVDAPGDQLPPERRGEAYHSHDKEKGGLMRETKYPGWKLIGLDMLGWINSGLDEQYGPYVVENEAHFLFNKPHKTGLKNGETFGLSQGGTLPGVNGHEIDIRLSTFKRLQEKPDLSDFPEEPAGIINIAKGKIPWKIPGREYTGESFDFYMRKIEKDHDQGADVIFWERPDGGQVFNAGAIRSGWALYTDPHFQKLIKNVLHHYGVKA